MQNSHILKVVQRGGRGEEVEQANDLRERGERWHVTYRH